MAGDKCPDKSTASLSPTPSPAWQGSPGIHRVLPPGHGLGQGELQTTALGGKPPELPGQPEAGGTGCHRGGTEGSLGCGTGGSPGWHTRVSPGCPWGVPVVSPPQTHGHPGPWLSPRAQLQHELLCPKHFPFWSSTLAPSELPWLSPWAGPAGGHQDTGPPLPSAQLRDRTGLKAKSQGVQTQLHIDQFIYIYLAMFYIDIYIYIYIYL